MATYRFDTTTTMKPHNREKWWIAPDMVRPIEVQADSVTEALNLWRNIVQERDYIEISRNAIRNKQPMYTEYKDGRTERTGYVITGKTDFDKGDYTGYCSQYIELWVHIAVVTIPDFEEE